MIKAKKTCNNCWILEVDNVIVTRGLKDEAEGKKYAKRLKKALDKIYKTKENLVVTLTTDEKKLVKELNENFYIHTKGRSKWGGKYNILVTSAPMFGSNKDIKVIHKPSKKRIEEL